MRRSRREAEFTDFYVLRSTSLRRTAYLVTGDWHLAEDLTQQALIKVYAAWSRVRPGTRDAYARRAVVNTCLSHLRTARRERPVESVPDRAEPEPDRPLDLAAALALLPPRQRAVIGLRFLDDLSVEDTAEALGVATGTVKSQTAAALSTLRDRLPGLHPSATEGELP